MDASEVMGAFLRRVEARGIAMPGLDDARGGDAQLHTDTERGDAAVRRDASRLRRRPPRRSIPALAPQVAVPAERASSQDQRQFDSSAGQQFQRQGR